MTLVCACSNGRISAESRPLQLFAYSCLLDSYRGRIRLVGIETIFFDCLGGGGSRNASFVCQRFQRCNGHIITVHLEKFAQLPAVIRSAITVRAKHYIMLVDEWPNLIGK